MPARERSRGHQRGGRGSAAAKPLLPFVKQTRMHEPGPAAATVATDPTAAAAPLARPVWPVAATDMVLLDFAHVPNLAQVGDRRGCGFPEASFCHAGTSLGSAYVSLRNERRHHEVTPSRCRLRRRPRTSHDPSRRPPAIAFPVGSRNCHASQPQHEWLAKMGPRRPIGSLHASDSEPSVQPKGLGSNAPAPLACRM